MSIMPRFLHRAERNKLHGSCRNNSGGYLGYPRGTQKTECLTLQLSCSPSHQIQEVPNVMDEKTEARSMSEQAMESVLARTGGK